jgi:spore coat protein A
VDIPLNLPINPVTLKGSLVLAPAERADIIIDFTGYANKKLILYNDAPGPFPGGAPIFDFLPNGTGAGPNTRELLRFDVVPVSGTPDLPLTITPATDLTAGNDPFLTAPGGPLQGLGIVGGQVNVALFQAAGIKVRQLTLNEAFDIYGRLAQLIGTNQLNPQGGGFGLEYLQPATELPIAGSVEIWQIANLSADTHPIHFHLVNVQVIARQPMNINNYKGTPAFTGPARLPDPDETGWKETVRMHPAEVITVAMKFDLPANPPNISVIPTSPRTGGHEYVYHCHILEHEEHDMMRPLVVI